MREKMKQRISLFGEYYHDINKIKKCVTLLRSRLDADLDYIYCKISSATRNVNAE